MLGKIKKAALLLTINPFLFAKHLIAALKRLSLLPKSPVIKKINGVLYEFDFNYDDALKYMYTGSYEIDTIHIMKGLLKKGDVFIDVGANIGYLSAIGAGFVGKTGQVHSFEPVPQYFERLKNMAMINKDFQIIVNQISLGEKEGEANIRLSNERNIGWNSMVFLSGKKDKIKEEIKVGVCRLDAYIEQKKLNKITLIKIDVEGFEFPVLKGLSRYLDNTGHRPAIICEINPFVCLIMKYSLPELSEYIRKYGYNIYNILNNRIKLNIAGLKQTTNVLLLPN